MVRLCKAGETNRTEELRMGAAVSQLDATERYLMRFTTTRAPVY